MNTVTASVSVLRWAAQRARLSDNALSARFRKWPLWLRGEAQPTLKQLEDFARLTHTAIGYFFLPQPPTLALPVPDFRTVRDEALGEPSSDLLDTLYLCRQRQDWYRDHARTGKRFARAIVVSTLEGLTSFPEAFRMLGIRKTATFLESARELETHV